MATKFGKKYPEESLPWPILWEGVQLVSEMERCALTSYPDFTGKWTNGWGETDGVAPGMVWTQEYADQRFCDSLTDFTSKVRDMLMVATSDHELAALVSLAYNIGLRNDQKRTGLYHSSVLRLHNAGKTQEAARAFSLYNKARNRNTGQLEVLPGLTRRRNLEGAMYLTPDHGELEMPQAVEPESSLAKSPINVGATVAGGSGVITAITAFAEESKSLLAPVKEVVDKAAEFVGVTPQQALAAVLIAAAVYVVYWRWKQRSGGWA
jgi:lysozyme